jgi:hypothetical protein
MKRDTYAELIFCCLPSAMIQYQGLKFVATLHVSAYSAIIRCVEIRGNCCLPRYLDMRFRIYSVFKWRPYIRFEVFTAVTMKYAVFWNVVPYRYCVNRRFGGTYLQGRRKKSACEEPAWAGAATSDTFLRNVGLHNIYTATHPRRRHSSKSISFLLVCHIYCLLWYACCLSSVQCDVWWSESWYYCMVDGKNRK